MITLNNLHRDDSAGSDMGIISIHPIPQSLPAPPITFDINNFTQKLWDVIAKNIKFGKYGHDLTQGKTNNLCAFHIVKQFLIDSKNGKEVAPIDQKALRKIKFDGKIMNTTTLKNLIEALGEADLIPFSHKVKREGNFFIYMYKMGGRLQDIVDGKISLIFEAHLDKCRALGIDPHEFKKCCCCGEVKKRYAFVKTNESLACRTCWDNDHEKARASIKKATEHLSLDFIINAKVKESIQEELDKDEISEEFLKQLLEGGL